MTSARWRIESTPIMLHEPGRLVLDEAGDVVAADQRDEIAEFLPVSLGQPAAMLMLLLRHVEEDQRRGREALAQRIGEGRVGAGIVVLARDRERQQFLLGQFGKRLHDFPPSSNSLELFQIYRGPVKGSAFLRHAGGLA